MYVITREGLGQVPMLYGSFAGMLGDGPKEFLDKVRASPENYYGLLLVARLHPFPLISNFIANYPYNQKNKLVDVALMNNFSVDQVVNEVIQISDAGLELQIKAERELWAKTIEALEKVDRSKLKPFLLEQAVLALRWVSDPKWLDTPDVEIDIVSYTFGRKFAERFLGELGLDLLRSGASGAHLVRLGFGLVRSALELQGKEPAFKKEVEQGRKKQAKQKLKKKRQRRRSK